MTRPLRIEFPGAVYHVTSRGDHREAIYAADVHRLWERHLHGGCGCSSGFRLCRFGRGGFRSLGCGSCRLGLWGGFFIAGTERESQRHGGDEERGADHEGKVEQTASRR